MPKLPFGVNRKYFVINLNSRQLLVYGMLRRKLSGSQKKRMSQKKRGESRYNSTRLMDRFVNYNTGQNLVVHLDVFHHLCALRPIHSIGTSPLCLSGWQNANPRGKRSIDIGSFPWGASHMSGGKTPKCLPKMAPEGHASIAHGMIWAPWDSDIKLGTLGIQSAESNPKKQQPPKKYSRIGSEQPSYPGGVIMFILLHSYTYPLNIPSPTLHEFGRAPPGRAAWARWATWR